MSLPRLIKGNIISMNEQAELLSFVRDDISEYETSGSGSPRMQLLRERAVIHGSISHVRHLKLLIVIWIIFHSNASGLLW